jgi:AP-4 complex subunit mu-1
LVKIELVKYNKQGEFIVMNYRINSEFQAPFRIFPYIDEVSNYKLELELRIRATYPKDVNASYLIAKIPVPKTNSSIHPELMKVD